MQPIILSILIPSIIERAESLHFVITELNRQIDEIGAKGKVEILTDVDNKQKSTGKKRDDLIKKANGKWVMFLDDDDAFVYDYVSEILKAISNGEPDVIGFCGAMTTNGHSRIHWKISKDLPYDAHEENGVKYYRRFNNHLSPIKKEIALQIGYKDIYVGEDYDYAVRLKESRLIKTEVFINKELYFYNYITNK